MMRYIRMIMCFLFGKSAYSGKSKGKLRHGEYLVTSGEIDKGDMIFLRTANKDGRVEKYIWLVLAALLIASPLYAGACIDGTEWKYTDSCGTVREIIGYENDSVYSNMGMGILGTFPIRRDTEYACSSSTIHGVGLLWSFWIHSDFYPEFGIGSAVMVGTYGLFFGSEKRVVKLPFNFIVYYMLERR